MTHSNRNTAIGLLEEQGDGLVGCYLSSSMETSDPSPFTIHWDAWASALTTSAFLLTLGYRTGSKTEMIRADSSGLHYQNTL